MSDDENNARLNLTGSWLVKLIQSLLIDGRMDIGLHRLCLGYYRLPSSLPFHTNIPDEGVLYFSAKALAEGKLSMRSTIANFFRAFDVIQESHRAIFKTTPVACAFLALGLRLFGSMRLILGFCGSR